MGETERGDSAARVGVSYWCGSGHEVRPTFAAETVIEIPEVWDCPRCGQPAGRDRLHPPSAGRNEPYKTHLAYVKERRTEKDGDAILDEALAALRERRRG